MFNFLLQQALDNNIKDVIKNTTYLGGMFATFYIGTKVMVWIFFFLFLKHFSKFSYLQRNFSIFNTCLFFNYWYTPSLFCSLCLMMPSKEITEVAWEGSLCNHIANCQYANFMGLIFRFCIRNSE